MKFGSELPLLAAALERAGHRCETCGFSLRCALAVHHRIPRALGGQDTGDNLAVLCANCHKAVHWLSTRSSRNQSDVLPAQQALGPAFDAVMTLATQIQTHAERIRSTGNAWVSAGAEASEPVSLTDALAKVAHRNHLSQPDAAAMIAVAEQVIARLPATTRERCAFRLPRGERFFSINVGSVLVFRTPGYADGAKRPDDDLYLLWPLDKRISVIPPKEWTTMEIGTGFKAIPCFNLELSFEEALSMRPKDWQIFLSACEAAAAITKATPWISNVSPDA